MLFGSSGIRRRYDLQLADLALSLGYALAEEGSEVVVGTDTRTTGPILAGAAIAGLLSGGARVSFGGIAPSPTVAYAARVHDHGLMVTASHNPEEYNGLKVFNPDGSSLTPPQQEDVERKMESVRGNGWDCQGEMTYTDLVPDHAGAILSRREIGRDLVAVVDCGNGAGSVITPDLLGTLGVATLALNCNTAGKFARPSEPAEEGLGFVGEMVRKRSADCGVVHDGDADRMMGFDGKGRFIDGDRLMVLFARYLDAGKVVTTMDASMVLDEVAEVQRTPVGDTYVSTRLLEWGDFGGEPSGAWIFPGHSLCPDGIYAAALFCEMASEWDIAGELDGIPRYPIVRESRPCDDAAGVLSRLGADSPTDGIRVAGEDGWFLIRASGTEPRVRITAEGRTPAVAKRLAERARGMLSRAKNA
ncbi:MAG TPA: phosphopentomutase/phosphoglucosamine mutase [Methanomicrobiales archaeon]|nr:phosphopentomutase/phosphoglucosamine mutase [Methanomicrobiales archaeon]